MTKRHSRADATDPGLRRTAEYAGASFACLEDDPTAASPRLVRRTFYLVMRAAFRRTLRRVAA